MTKCNKEIIDLEEALDEAQENLTNTLEKLSQAEKEADEASRSRKVHNKTFIHRQLTLIKQILFCTQQCVNEVSSFFR